MINSLFKPWPVGPWGQISKEQRDGRGGSKSPGEEGNLGDLGRGVTSAAVRPARLGGELKQEGEGRELSVLGCCPISAPV